MAMASLMTVRMLTAMGASMLNEDQNDNGQLDADWMRFEISRTQYYDAVPGFDLADVDGDGAVNDEDATTK